MVPLGPAQALQPLCPAQMGPPKAAVIIFSLPCQQTSQGGHGIDEPPIDNLSQIRNHPTPSGQQLPKRSESISDGGGNDGTSPTILGLNKHCYPQAAVFHCHPYTQCKQHFFFLELGPNFGPISCHNCNYWAIAARRNQPDQAEAAGPLQSYSTDQAKSTRGNQILSTPQ